MDFIDYRKSLGIGFNDKELQSIFFTKIFNILDYPSFLKNQISQLEYLRFCQDTGTRCEYRSQESYENLVLRKLHSVAYDIREFLSYYIAFINCQEDSDIKIHTKKLS